MKTLILDHRQIQQKINRLAHQVYESNHREKSLVIAGIEPHGKQLAQKISTVLKEISPLEVHVVRLTVDKDRPLSPIVMHDGTEDLLKDASVVLVDDVLNTGRTMIYGVKYFLGFPVRKLQTLVLVDRDHKSFPIHADMAGLQLSTNLQEHVSVEFKEGEDAAYLL